MAEIHIHNLVKKFQGNVTAVDSLSLTIADGEFVSLLGPSGCGKTTTLRMLAGLEEPTSGEILLDDKVLFSSRTGEYIPPEKRGMGMVFQSYALWPHMTVSENIRFGLIQHKVPKDEQSERIKTVLKLLQIEDLGKRYSYQMSGGQQQRVALARMLALQPNTLLLDEPLSNLDAQLRIEMRSELKRLHERLNNTTVFVTHDQLEAMTLSTHIAVMRDGKLQQYDTPMEIYRKPANLFVAKFVGSPPINIITEESSPELFGSAKKHLGRKAANATQIAFRPESMVVNPENVNQKDQWYMKGKVVAILPTGPEWILQLESGSALMFASTDSEPKFSMGDNCTIAIKTDAMLMFDQDEVRVDV